jgi:hypothetical protein
MDRDELLSELTEDVLSYVMHGSVPEERFFGEIRPAGLDERFTDFESLIRLHFLLRPAVVEFVEALPCRIRDIKTQTKSVTSRRRGRADGRINWSATFRERAARAPGDRSLFVCDDRTESYDIAENVVLKRLLAVVHSTLVDCEPYLRMEYDWVTERWQENLELVGVLSDIVERNVHVRRIRDPETYEPTERMLHAAERSRSAIYRDAAELLREYRAAVSGDEAAVRGLLERTAITPDDEETLLELYVLFKYVAAIEQSRGERFQVHTIESGAQEVARMDTSDAEFVLYHDRSGKQRGLSFVTAESVDETPRNALSRAEMVKREAREVEAHYFDEERTERHTKRPDVIVLEVRSDSRREYLVTEVKNSTRRETIQRGIEETLEYLAFLRQDGEFVFDGDSDFFGSGWNGVLVVQDLPGVDTRELEDQRSIRILQASDVEQHLQDVLNRVITDVGDDS